MIVVVGLVEERKRKQERGELSICTHLQSSPVGANTKCNIRPQ